VLNASAVCHGRVSVRPSHACRHIVAYQKSWSYRHTVNNADAKDVDEEPTGSPPNEATNTRGVPKICDFPPIKLTRPISTRAQQLLRWASV